MSHRSPALIRALPRSEPPWPWSWPAAPPAHRRHRPAAVRPAGPSSSAQAGASGLTSQYQGPPVTLRLGYFPNITHATAIVGVQAGTLQPGARPERDLPDVDVQRRFVGLRGAPLERHRRHVHRAQPGDQCLVEVERGGQDHLRGDLRRRTARGQAGDHLGGGPQGQEAGHAPARQHPGRRPPDLAAGPGPQDRPAGWRRRVDRAPGQCPDAPGLRDRARSTVPGSPSRGPAG